MSRITEISDAAPQDEEETPKVANLKVSFAQTSPCHMMSPTHAFCQKDGELLQLWTDSYSPYCEWRPIPSYESALPTYGCDNIVR